MQAFSKQEGINIKTLHYWKRKYRELHLPAGRQSMPSNVVRPKAEEKQPGFASLVLSRHEQPGAITIQYCDGTRISFPSVYEAARVKQFIPAFNK